jgi:hypothetical protein
MVPATKKHAQLIGKDCCARDRAAIRSIGGWNDPERYARANINRSSEAWAFYYNEHFIGIVGVICFAKTALRDGYQFPWYLLAEDIDAAALWGAANEFKEGLRDRYPLLITMVRAIDAEAQTGLTALGFSIMAPGKFGSSTDLWCKAVLDTRQIEVAHGA